ncbi:MAG: iron-containing alcohol dehydrogenase [Leptospiraceae bacterium]|nr:iron-containing alcohol dehydrogenase [Leptospiraceae bacterium]MDW8306364.1 iron-containing alcohol dehydrogenase [Leptospiraceae bacterium]
MQGISWAHFALPTRIHLENDSLYRIGSYVRAFGSRGIILVLKSENKNPEELAILRTALMKHLEGVILYDDLEKEPSSDQIDSATYFVKKAHADLIIAYGGMETFSAAKAVALLATNTLFAADLLNNKGRISNPALPILTIPVEPTMGEELTPSFTLLDSSDGYRKYMEHESLFPVACFYDPKVCQHLTSDSAARSGGATLVYAIESQLSPKSNPLTSALILRAIDMIRRNLPLLYKEPKNEKHISTLLWSSAMTGIAAAACSVGASFAIAWGLKSVANLNFHDALTLILPHVMEYYLTAAPAQYIHIARSLGEDVKDISVIEAAIKAVEGVRRLFIEVNLPMRLSEFDIKKHQLADVARFCASFPQLENSPRALTRHEIESILLAAF